MVRALPSHRRGPGSIPRLDIIIMQVEFFAGSRPCFKRFFSRYSGFPLSSKTKISEFQFDSESDSPEDKRKIVQIGDTSTKFRIFNPF